MLTTLRLFYARNTSTNQHLWVKFRSPSSVHKVGDDLLHPLPLVPHRYPTSDFEKHYPSLRSLNQLTHSILGLSQTTTARIPLTTIVPRVFDDHLSKTIYSFIIRWASYQLPVHLKSLGPRKTVGEPSEVVESHRRRVYLILRVDVVGPSGLNDAGDLVNFAGETAIGNEARELTVEEFHGHAEGGRHALQTEAAI